MIDRPRRDRANFAAMQFAVANVLEGLLDHLPATVTCMVNVGQKIQRPHRLLGKHENRVDELIVRERRRAMAVENQLAIPERAVVKSVLTKLDSLVFEGLVIVVHGLFSFFATQSIPRRVNSSSSNLFVKGAGFIFLNAATLIRSYLVMPRQINPAPLLFRDFAATLSNLLLC